MSNNNLTQFNRGKPKDDDFLSKIKCKKEKLFCSLNEVESFLSKSSCSIRYLKLFSFLQHNCVNNKK